MLAGVRFEEVIGLVGDHALGADARRKAFDHFGIKYPENEGGFVVSQAEHPIAKLFRDHKVLLCSVADSKDGTYGHAVVVYDGHLYDPWRGIDPQWPWTRHIWKAMPIESAPGVR